MAKECDTLKVIKKWLYSETCGSLPTVYNAHYTLNWWKCAFSVAENKGVCSDAYNTWYDAVRGDIHDHEGSYPVSADRYFEPDGDYVIIRMGDPPQNIGRYKWKC